MKVFRKFGHRILSRQDWLGRMTTKCVGLYEGKHGPVYAQRRHKQAIAKGRSIKRGLSEIGLRWPNVHSSAEEKPVFILSAGWRSGSTMVQRLVMSHQPIIIWGEVYSHARIIRHLSDGVSAITSEWPQEEWLVNNYDLDRLNTTFSANLYPEVQDLLEASLAYIRCLLDEPARQRGFQRWGLKDVRLTISDAFFLKWLFPNAKFIFLCRNPYNAYRSYRMTREWYNEWPDDPVFTAGRFGRHWQDLVKGFHEGWHDIGGLFVRYEDLCSGLGDIASLEEYLELEINADLLDIPVGSHRSPNDAVPQQELKMLRREVEETALLLGYQTE